MELKVRGIGTNFVVYYRIELQLASCIANLPFRKRIDALTKIVMGPQHQLASDAASGYSSPPAIPPAPLYLT